MPDGKEDVLKRKNDTLRETILFYAREIADREGLERINIRSIAKKAGIASGTVYNYYSNKDEILLALTEEYWHQALLEMETVVQGDSFCEQVEQIFIFLRERIDSTAGKLMGSLGNVEAAGENRMQTAQTRLRDFLICRMEQDMSIQPDVWDESFTKDAFEQFIVLHMMTLLKIKESNPDFLFQIIRRTIYKREGNEGCHRQ